MMILTVQYNHDVILEDVPILPSIELKTQVTLSIIVLQKELSKQATPLANLA